MKELDFAKMLEQKARGNELRGLRGLVEDTPLGPEVLTGHSHLFRFGNVGIACGPF